MTYKSRGELGLAVLEESRWDALVFIHSRLFLSDDFGENDPATRRLGERMSQIDEGQDFDRPFKLVGKRALEIYFEIGQVSNDSSAVYCELAGAINGEIPEYRYSTHRPVVAA